MSTFYSHGKLLLTGEYVVLDGALALAVPAQKGQSLNIKPIDKPVIIWVSKDENQQTWFEGEFHLHEIYTMPLKAIEPHHVSDRILQILIAAKSLNPDFLSKPHGFSVTTALEFPRDWGLGSSSTLITNIANWASVDAYKLLGLTFGGSGYDIACAQSEGSLTYTLNQAARVTHPVSFYPKFSEHLYFVHLNKKQNSRDGIAHYKSNQTNVKAAISKITALTKLIIHCDALITFEGLIERHEAIISKLIKLPTVKQALFSDFEGSIKSLGAWGGDFILVTSKDNPEAYFKSKGYDTILTYDTMVLNKRSST